MLPEQRQPSARVLIVDDEPVLARAMKRLLAGHIVELEHDGASALARLQRGERFDAIVCDLLMPTLSGMGLHQALTELAPSQAACIIFVSGGAFDDETNKFLASVPNLHIIKPFDGDALIAAVEAVVAQAHLAG